jgi:repressor LexA
MAEDREKHGESYPAPAAGSGLYQPVHCDTRSAADPSGNFRPYRPRGTVIALHHIEAIEKKGYLRRREGSARSIVLTGKAGKSEALVFLPIVGTVSAGLPQPTAENGEIVVALIDDAATLKRFYREGDHIRLQPENRHMQPILIRESDAETVVVGKLLKTIRSYD